MSAHTRRMMAAFAAALLLAPLHAWSQPGAETISPIDPDLPRPGSVISQDFGAWSPWMDSERRAPVAVDSHVAGLTVDELHRMLQVADAQSAENR